MPYSSKLDDTHFQKSCVNIPNHSTPTSMQCIPQTQLQFNLHSCKEDGTSQIHKPKPIIIEKLLPYPTKPVEHETSSFMKDISNVPDTMLSSEKLAFAVQLAKMDIKKLKNMLSTDITAGDTEEVIPMTKVLKKRTNTESEKIKKSKKVIEKQKKEINVEAQRHILHLYPEPKENKMFEEPVKVPLQKSTKANRPTTATATNKGNEMKRLPKDLVKYLQALDVVVQKLNQENFVEILKNDDELKEERERNIIRAEEQCNRSARMLYMLQRKVEDLHNELSSKKSNVKQTKKSRYVTNLASAHRAAVRALQTFVNHAPLYYNTTGKFPPMYKALALLIQQLTTLSSDTVLGFETEAMEIIEDLIASLSKASEKRYLSCDDRTKKHKVPRLKPALDKHADNKKQFVDKHIDWLKKKADELNIKSFREGEESTPERASSLRHAIQSLDADEMPSKQTSPSRPVLKAKKQSKSSVLLPNELKNKRLKMPTRPYHPEPPGNMNYAAATVISKIREKPPVERKEKTPPSSPRKYVGFTDDEPSTPKKRDQKIIDEARSFISPSQQKKSVAVDLSHHHDSEFDEDGRLTPTKVKQMEKEVNREKWLQHRKSEEISKLDAIEKMNTNWLNKLKTQFEHSNHLVMKHAEEHIKECLKPLLEKAEVISQDEARREEHYKISINRRLADIASQKAMSEGERLAEYILDDLIQEAALDIQKIETDEHAEMEAAFMFDRENLETIAQRLETLEIEEDEIRRHWKNVQYSEIDSNKNGTKFHEINRDYLNVSHTTARSVMFTAPLNKGQLPLVPDHNTEPKPPIRNQIHIPDALLNTILLYKQRFENYLSKSIHNSWNFHPHDVLDELSEHILDELLADISEELNENCSKFVDDIYEKEFLNVT